MQFAPRFLFLLRCSILVFLLGSGATVMMRAADSSADPRPRLAVLTDIGGDPDDEQSLVRLMVYANAFDIELLMATAAGTPGELKVAITRPDLIRQIVAAYGQVRGDLVKNSGESRWPSEERLQSVILSGNPQRGRRVVGEGHSTAGSRRLLERMDAGSPERPLYISVWGGQTDLAQALWEARHGRSDREWRLLLSKFQVYDVADQDGLADWMRGEFPGLNYVLSQAFPGHDKRTATFRGMYLTGDTATTSRAWIEEHVRRAGPLGAHYPLETWTPPNPHGCMKEGDTPAWFFFLPQGGNIPSDPSRPGWGGRYRKSPDGVWVDLVPDAAARVDPRETVSQWRGAFQSDFARRLKWITPKAEVP